MYLILACVENSAATVTLTFYVYQSSDEIDGYWLVFIVSILLVYKILKSCQN